MSQWIIEQTWNDVLFFHVKVKAELIQPLVPFPLDLYQGEAVLSIVPFWMSHIRFPYLPVVPALSSLWELNLRTYVEVQGVKGVYFFTLDTDSKIGELIARNVFHLPYRYSQISGKVKENHYQFQHERGDLSLSFSVEIKNQTPTDEIENWAVERYSLFTHRGQDIYQGVVQHEKWPLQSVSIHSLSDQFSRQLNIPCPMEVVSSSYCPKLKVRFRPFKKVGRLNEHA